MKLSEIKDDEMLLVGERVMSKEDLLNELVDNKSCGIKNPEVYITRQYQASLDAKDIMESAIENEYQNMFEVWDQDIWNDVTEEDLKDIQIVLDRILERSKDHNVSYEGIELVEIDFEEEK
jgi:hypothetical protein